jgi:hypothetical protein
MKKVLRWVGIAALTPILLFTILAALLYCPPVQNWAVQQVAAIASEKTGMEITVGHVNLEFPLDLGIDGFRAIKPGDTHPEQKDTLADVGHLVADVQLWPLLQKRVVVNELSLHDARINTDGLISDLQISGELGELWLSSHGIDLDGETVEVNGARLADGRINIALSDTAAVDTTKSDVRWKIMADSLTISQTAVSVRMPGDTLQVGGWLGRAVARGADIDLGRQTYKVASLDWHDGRLSYDDRSAPVRKGPDPREREGLDLGHLALTDIRLGIDRISYTPEGLQLNVRQTHLREKCGIEVTELAGGLKMDSTFNRMQLVQVTLRTPDSNIATEADIDLRKENSGKATGRRAMLGNEMKVRLMAQLGKQDLLRVCGDLPQKFMERFPNRPLTIRGSVDGNMQHLKITGIDINLATALDAKVNGTLSNVTDLSRLKADLTIAAKTKQLNFMTALIDPKMSGTYRIPDGISLNGRLTANGTSYGADMTASEAGGSIRLKGHAQIPLDAKGRLATQLMSYDADISIDRIDVHHYLPKDSIYTLSADISAKGYGTDLLSSSSRLDANALIRQLKYGYMNLDRLTATATLKNGRGQASITGKNALIEGQIGADLLLSSKRIEGTIDTDLDKADLYQLRLAERQLTIGMRGSLKVSSDLKQTHYLSGLMDDVYVRDSTKTYAPGKLGVLLKTTPDTTYVRAQSGDFILKIDGSGGYKQLLAQTSLLADSVAAKFEQKVIDQPAIKRLLPTLRLHLESKRQNPVANLLRAMGIDFKEMEIDLDTSPLTGINGRSHIYSLVYDSTRIDTIRLNLTQKGERLTYQAQIRNNKRNPQFVFNALLDGHLHEHGLLGGLRYYDDKGRMGVRLGATVEMEDNGLRFKLMPERPTIGYKEFNLNKDNFIFLGRDKKIQAKIDLIADDKTGVKLYTENQDSTMLQDVTVSVNRLDLKEITSVLPYLPKLTGKLNGDFHILQDPEGHFSVASDLAVQNMTYENSPIGNISAELVYMMKEENTHAIEARLMLDDEEFGLLTGNYQGEGEGNIDATFKMTRFPLSIANGFVPDQIVGLQGYGEGEFKIKGTTVHPDVDGEIFVEDAYLVSEPYGVKMRFDNDPVRLVDSKLLIENLGLYAYNDEPLILMGNVDFSNMNRITMDMRMRARNLLLINSKQEAKSIAWGKAYVNFLARMQGPLEQLKMRGRLDVLGSTDMTYLLLDSPLSTDNRLDELVKFTDFSDSTVVIETRPLPTGFEADLTINISQGAHILCNLNTERTNYVDLIGGGDLRMRYTSEGIDLKGKYTLTSGNMKYSLPVIPLKTFHVKEGSYVEFTGDPYNPKLNITATERTKSVVNDEYGGTRSVVFDCGVEITKTLNDMGLRFIIQAPEDQAINGELLSMSLEEQGKIAVAMLTTGMYLDSNSSGNFSMNTALSAFLQSEINQIAGSALKTVDINIGVENSVSSSGAATTDYSFQFSKRFFNNRLKIEIGGLVSTGASVQGQKQSFFDNVSMEYRLNQEGTKNLKIFYKQNSYDWLEGYTSEYGAGFVWRKKFDSWRNLFRSTTPQSTMPHSIKTDSIKVNK